MTDGKLKAKKPLPKEGEKAQPPVPAPRESEFRAPDAAEEEQSMIFTETEVFEHERFMRDWLSERIEGHAETKRTIREYGKIYAIAGEILENYYGKKELTKQDLELVKYALNVRRTYQKKAGEIYVRTAAQIEAMEKKFSERMEGQKKYMELFKKEIASIRRMSRDKPDRKDVLLGNRIGHKYAKWETTLPEVKVRKAKAEKIRGEELKEAGREFEEGIELIKKALEKYGSARNTAQIEEFRGLLAKLEGVVKKAGEEGTMSAETADSIVLALRKIHAGLSKHSVPRKRGEKQT